MVSCRLYVKGADAAFPVASALSTSPMKSNAKTPCPREAYSIPTPVSVVSQRDARRIAKLMFRLIGTGPD